MKAANSPATAGLVVHDQASKPRAPEKDSILKPVETAEVMAKEARVVLTSTDAEAPAQLETIKQKAQDEPQAGAITEIHHVVEADITKWRAAKQQANPFSYVAVADEVDMRRCIMEMERARRGIPLEARNQHLPSGVEWNVRSYLDAQRSQLREPPWKIKGLVVEGCATQVSAHPHGMKSLSWLNAALESVALHTVWGHFDASNVRRVLYCESEDPEWLVVARIKGLAKGLGLAPDNELPGFHYVCPGPFDLVKEADGLTALLAKFQPDFAVLSTLQSVLAGRDWLSQKEMQDVNALIVRLSRICPLVVLTHSPWNPKQRRAAGTITQFANFPVAMHYEKVSRNNGDRAIHIVVDSKLGGSVDDFHLKLQTKGNEDDPSSVRGLVYGGEGRPQGADKGAILAALANDSEATSKELAEQLGVTERYVRKIKADQSKNSRRKGKRGTTQAEASYVEPTDSGLIS